MLTTETIKDTALRQIANKVYSGKRITTEEGIYLYEHAELGFAGELANFVREKKNGKNTYFNRNYHIEPTNVCIFSCKFCSYSQEYKHKEEGWELSKQQIMDKVLGYAEDAVTEVHIVGGVHPKMDINYFADILREIKKVRPNLHIKGFTAVELDYMIRKGRMEIKQGLQFLKDSGLDSIPGGGAEIFDETIRKQICADKCTGEEWLFIHQTAHSIGLKSNATMLYGHIENYAHRIDHMNRLRLLQDKTGGFNTFIPLKFRNKDNDMSHVAESSVIEDLRNYAIARIFMDNFDHIKAYWPMIGRQTAQLSQNFGVDDLDGTIDDSTKIYSMAGAEEQTPSLTTDQLIDLISGAGKNPVERDTLYGVVKDYKNKEAASM